MRLWLHGVSYLHNSLYNYHHTPSRSLPHLHLSIIHLLLWSPLSLCHLCPVCQKRHHRHLYASTFGYITAAASASSFVACLTFLPQLALCLLRDGLGSLLTYLPHWLICSEIYCWHTMTHHYQVDPTCALNLL